MSTTLNIQDSNKESSANINVSSKDIVSCCVKDLSLQIKNRNNENENMKDKSTKNKTGSPTKINISIEKNDNNIDNNNKNKINDNTSKTSNKSNEEKEIQFSILLPKQYRESKNCKIKLSMDMNISIDDNPNQKSGKNSNNQSKNSIVNSTSSLGSSKSNSNNKLQGKVPSKNEKDNKTKVKKNIIDNLNNNEPIKSRSNNSSISNNNNNNNNNNSSSSSSRTISLTNNSKSNSNILKNINSNSVISNSNNSSINNTNNKLNSLSSNSNNSKNSSYNKIAANPNRKSSSISSKPQSKFTSECSIDSSKKTSKEKIYKSSTSNANSNINSNSNLNSNSNSFNKTDTTSSDRDEELLRIRQLKDDIDKVIEEGDQKGKLSGTSKNSSSENSLNNQSSQKSSINTIEQLFSSKDSVNSKPPLASSSKSSSVIMNNISQDLSNGNSDNNNDVLKNLYLPKDNNRVKSKEELAIQVQEQENNNDEYGVFSPMDDKEYNYLIDLIDNEYSIDESFDKVNSNESTESNILADSACSSNVNSSKESNINENEKILSKDPSIVYNDDNKEKLERCYSSSFELSGVWKHFIVPYTTESDNKTNKAKKDCASRVYDDFTTESKKKAYHHWVKIMLPEYNSFISRHSLQTICAQNYIIAALIEKMSFFKMAEDDPNPVIRESPQYNVERLDICLNYIKNILDIPIAVTAYDLHLGKLASIFSLLTQLIRYYKRGKELKSKGDQESRNEEKKNIPVNDIIIEEGEDDTDNMKIVMSYDDEINEDSSLCYSKDNFEQ